MKLRVAGIVSESIVDGPGYRLAVFAQGCQHGCEGCHNPHTHDVEGGKLVEVSEIAVGLANRLLKGLTLTGGEPFLQPVACTELARLARAAGKDVWAYTGYTFEQLLCMDDTVAALLRECDVLVDGPFVLKKRTLNLPFRGSGNQRVIDVPATLSCGEIRLWVNPYE